jgi:hypothetical protein
MGVTCRRGWPEPGVDSATGMPAAAMGQLKRSQGLAAPEERVALCEG